MRTNEYTTSKSFPESLRNQKMTWDVPTTVAEAVDATKGPNGTPFFEDEATLVAYAVAQLNIRKAHGAASFVEKEASKKENPRAVGFDEAQDVARGIVAKKLRERTEGGAKPTAEVKAKAAQHAKVENALADNMGKLTPAQLKGFVTVGLLTQEQVDAELARRAA